MCIVISSLPWHGWSESVDIGPLSFLARKTFRNCLDKVKVFFRIAFTPVFHIWSQLIQSCIAYHSSSLLEQFYSVSLRQSNQFASHWPHDASPSVSESLQALLDCLPSTFSTVVMAVSFTTIYRSDTLSYTSRQLPTCCLFFTLHASLVAGTSCIPRLSRVCPLWGLFLLILNLTVTNTRLRVVWSAAKSLDSIRVCDAFQPSSIAWSECSHSLPTVLLRSWECSSPVILCKLL